MVVIGLTGPSGSGKSTLCALAAEHGINSINADEVYHGILVPPSLCLDEISEYFGGSILNGDGSLNRPALAAIVFEKGAEEKLSKLNSITHKYVKEKFRSMISDMEGLGFSAVIVDAPTLFESGFDKECDFTLCLLSEKSLRTERIIHRDGISSDRAEMRMSAQKSDEYFIVRADHVLINDSDKESLKRTFFKILDDHGIAYEN